MVVSMGNCLAGFFGCGVKTGRLVSSVELRKWVLGVEPVDGAGRGPDDRRLRIGSFGYLEKIDEPGNVGRHIGLRVLHGVPYTSLRRQVEYVGEWYDVEELRQHRPVVEVGLNDENLVLLQHGLPCPLQRRVVVGVEIVESQHAVAPLLERERAVGPDEPGGTGDEHRHSVGPLGGRGVSDLLLPRGTADSPAVEGGGEEVRVVEVVGPAGVVRRERRVVEGEEEDEDEGDEEGGAEEELGGGIEQLGAVDSAEVAVVALELYGLACIRRRSHHHI